MSWQDVARKDFQDASRSRALWALSIIFVILSGLIVWAFSEILGGGNQASILGLIGALKSPMTLFISIVALLVGHKAIVGERESGSLKVLLSLPHSRLDVVLGKLVGRTVVLWLAIGLGFLTGTVVWFGTVGSGSLGKLGFFAVLTLVFALAYMSVAVAVSAATRSGSRATAIAIGVWLVFQFLWSLIILALRFAASGFSLEAVLTRDQPGWAAFLESLNPASAYDTATTTLIPGAQEAANLGDSLFVTPWWALLILLVWIVGPTAFGYWRFAEADL
jgi:ABC-2 type transport system permease protein